MSLIHSGKSYCLHLANGHGWNLVATNGTEQWLSELASIMELKACELNGYPKLIFTNKELDNEAYKEPVYALDMDIQKILPGNGWKSSENSKVIDMRLRFWYHDDVPDKVCYVKQDENYEDSVMRMWGVTHLIYLREQISGGIPFHAGLVELNGQGVLLAAPGGIGKSTCCRRILDPWHAIADDQTLIVRDSQERYVIHPFPTWSNFRSRLPKKSWNVESHFPLSAIFFLQQAQNDEVIRLERGAAAMCINQSSIQAYIAGLTTFDREERKVIQSKTFNNSCELAKVIPAYVLRVSLNGRFWEEIEKVF
ncbi:MAG: SynChlorMet cassette protein ScmC [Candidatus Poribacteria bacterium]